VTEDGHPWIGAPNPVVEITEFADYQCFQCWKMHQVLRRIVAEFPDKVRLVHVHYPMDHTVNPIVHEPFHIGSARMAEMAIYAMKRGKFWEMNDYLYYHWRLNGMVSMHRAATKLGLDEGEMRRAVRSKYVKEVLLKLNIRRGMKRRILGTPSFIIDGKVYEGSFPFKIIDSLHGH